MMHARWMLRIAAMALCILGGLADASVAEDRQIFPEGCYFLSRGGGLVVIGRNADGTLGAETIWPQTWATYYPTVAADGAFVLEFDHSEDLRRTMGLERQALRAYYRLEESETGWALASYRDLGWMSPKVDAQGNEVAWPITFDTPIPDFLIRVPEGPWRAHLLLCRSIAEQRSPAAEDLKHLLESAKRLRDAAPENPAARIIWMDALVRARDHEALQHAKDEWGQALGASPNPHLRSFMATVDTALAGHRLEVEGRNAAPVLDRIFGTLESAETRRALARSLKDFEQNVPEPRGVVVATVPNFLDYQVNIKVACVESIFAAMRGSRDESREIAASCYRAGQLVERGGHLIDFLIGIAMRQYAENALELHLLDVCETPAEVGRLAESLESMRDLAQDWDREEVLANASRGEQPWTEGRGNYLEAVTRNRIANQRFELLRSAAAVRKYRLAAGIWPVSPEAVNATFRGQAPKDLFTGEWILGGQRGDDFVVYSVGPDKADDGASIAYDPTNGTLSGGDVLLALPAERRYPFPRGGFDPSTVDDVRRVFPNGLPRDPFANDRTRGLTVHAAEPPLIFSFGPDADQGLYENPGKSEVLVTPVGRIETSWTGPVEQQPQYDPTNGAVSAGNLHYRSLVQNK